MFRTIHDVALMLDRERVGRDASPTGRLLDSQTVKASSAKVRNSSLDSIRKHWRWLKHLFADSAL